MPVKQSFLYRSLMLMPYGQFSFFGFFFIDIEVLRTNMADLTGLHSTPLFTLKDINLRIPFAPTFRSGNADIQLDEGFSPRIQSAEFSPVYYIT